MARNLWRYLCGLEKSKTKFNLNTRTLRDVDLDYFYETDIPSFKNTIVRGTVELTEDADSLKKVVLKVTNVGIIGVPEKFVKTETRTCSQF